MEENLSEEEEKLFKEFLLVNGFVNVGSRNPKDNPSDKPCFLLLTKNETLYKKLRHWACDNNKFILYNPEIMEYEILNNLFAFVIDQDLLPTFPFPELLKQKYVKAELEIELLKYILTDFKI